MVVAAGIAADLIIVGASAYGASQQSAAAKKAAESQAKSADEATQLQRDIYNQTRADLAPYRLAGGNALKTLSTATQPGRYFNEAYTGRYGTPFTRADFRQDPGYQFRVQEGLKALDRTAASRGTLLSGGQLEAAERYNSGLASQEYGNAFNRFQVTGTADFNRFNTERTNRFNRLAAIAGLGQTANAQSQQAGQVFGQQAGENITGAGNARAAGIVGAANAQTSGYQNVGNALTQGYQNYLLLNALQQQNPYGASYTQYGQTGVPIT